MFFEQEKITKTIDNNKIDQSEEAAFEAVQAQLKKQMEKYQPPFLVLMGVAAVRHVLGLSTSFDEVRGQLIANESFCAAVTYSVNELLKVPSLKSACTPSASKPFSSDAKEICRS